MSNRDDIIKLHNESAGRIVADIVRPTIVAGGDYTDVLVLLESVATGVLTAVVSLGGDNKVLDIFVDAVRGRMAQIRLGDAPVAGHS